MTKSYMVWVAHTKYYYRYVKAGSYDEAEDTVALALGSDEDKKLIFDDEEWEVYKVEEAT